jgi:hypothetical protein
MEIQASHLAKWKRVGTLVFCTESEQDIPDEEQPETKTEWPGG